MKHTSTSTEAWSKNHNSREIEKTECANSFSELAFEWFDVIWLLPQQKNTDAKPIGQNRVDYVKSILTQFCLHPKNSMNLIT